MAATTSTYPGEPPRDGYSAIPSTPAAPPNTSATATTAVPSSVTPAAHVQAMARGAGAAAAGAKDAVAEILAAPMRDLSIYTEPLNPAAQLTLKDRAQLVLESCRPWQEFADPKAMARPPPAELKLRVAHNVETFFYNYFTVALVLLALFAVFHPMRALLLALTVVAGVLLYILFPEDYVITDNFSVSKRMKHAIMAVLALLVLTVGHVFSLLFRVAITFIPLVLIHASFRSLPSSN